MENPSEPTTASMEDKLNLLGLENLSDEAKGEVSGTQEPEAEPKAEGEEAKYTEADIAEKVKSLQSKWQSVKDIELKKLYTEITRLKAQVAVKEDDRELDAAFQADLTDTDEETAKKRDAARRKFAERYREFKSKNEAVEAAKKETDSLTDRLLGVEKRQRATDFYLDLREKGEVTAKEKTAILEQLSSVENTSEFERITKLIVRELATKRQPTKTDSGRSTGGGGNKTYTSKQIAEMSPEQYVKEHDAIEVAYREGRVK